jgi:hypothetical protein
MPKFRKLCIVCSGETTPRQIEVMKAYWEQESIKEAGMILDISSKAVDDVMRKLKERWKQTTSLGVFKVALRKGLITFCILLTTLSCYGLPWWKRKPPPTPSYTTNSLAYWSSVKDATVYGFVLLGRTNLTFGTNITLTSLTNSSNYFGYVQCAGTNGIWSVPSCSVYWKAGSGLTNYCPITMDTTTQ